ncbi:hypothetical protein AB4Y43_16950 [Paraburkholderia sp. BR10872]|uniref:hypothetical protein n=1 Tax=Paraburkholderia sp. BR10872 TaxID=3236989 RepID=UPI0034D2B8AD
MDVDTVDTANNPPRNGGADEHEADKRPLRKLIEDRYKEANAWHGYAVALVVFYVVYSVLLYWTFFSWGEELTAAHSGQAVSPAFWRVVRLGGTGAFGATLAAIWHLHWRVVRLDLVPRTLFQLSARLCASPFLAIAFSTLFIDQLAFPLAFCAGAFGDEGIRLLRVKAYGLMRSKGSDASLPLWIIQGITSDDELRLSEEGIADVEHMAKAPVLTLATNTGYSLQRLVDWKDQAYLCCYVGYDISKWREQLVRGSLDILGLAGQYYQTKNYGTGADAAAANIERESDRQEVLQALAKALNIDKACIERLIVSIYNDKRVYQLWQLSKSFSRDDAADLDGEAIAKGELRETA